MIQKMKMVTLALGLALVATACGSTHHAEEHGAWLVSSPLVQDTPIVQEYVAQIRASQHIELRAMEKGYLEEIQADEGQLVTEGQPLFRIMPRVLEAEVKMAKAEAEFATIEYQNTKALQDEDVVSANELALAKARLDKADAELALASTHLGLTQVKAPFDGIMGRLEVRRGSLVDEGELLTTLSDNRTMWVYFNVSEAEYLDYQRRVRKDEVVRVDLRMANGEVFPYKGKIDTIEADFDNETGNIAFRASFDNPDGLLRHGETGKVMLTSMLEQAMLVPQKATYEILDKTYVFVVDGEDVVHSREIHVLEELPHLFVVDGGLTKEEHVLLEGLRRVKDGDEIEADYEAPESVVASLALPAE